MARKRLRTLKCADDGPVEAETEATTQENMARAAAAAEEEAERLLIPSPTIYQNVSDQLADQGFILLEDKKGNGPFEAKEQLLAACCKSKEELEEIVIWINSDGGNLHDFLALHDAILLARTKFDKYVICIVNCTAASAAAIVLQAGNERWATPNAIIMIHQVSYDPGEGTVSEHETESKIVKEKFQSMVFKVWAKRMKMTVKQLEKYIADNGPDIYYTPQEALKVGLIDIVQAEPKTKKIPSVKKKAVKKATKKAAKTTPAKTRRKKTVNK
jgi:ATP-dependent protease ClpP protease subunit